MLKRLVRLVMALNSNAKASQLAAGFACGLLLAIVPSNNLLWLMLFILTFFLKIHRGMQLLMIALFKLLAPLASVWLDRLGWAVLRLESLQGLFTDLYNLPIAPLTRFNNTLVAGGLMAGFVLWIPVFLLVLGLVKLYRARLAPLIVDSKFVKHLKKLPLVQKIAVLASKAVVVVRSEA
ncbi:hypothetical protein MASR2M48_13970 [Spirochaetota bacterium]